MDIFFEIKVTEFDMTIFYLMLSIKIKNQLERLRKIPVHSEEHFDLSRNV